MRGILGTIKSPHDRISAEWILGIVGAVVVNEAAVQRLTKD